MPILTRLDKGPNAAVEFVFRSYYGISLIQSGAWWKPEPLDQQKYETVHSIVEGAYKKGGLEPPKLFHAPLIAHGQDAHSTKADPRKQQMPHVIPNTTGFVISDVLLQKFTPEEASMYVFHEQGHLSHIVKHIGLKALSTNGLSRFHGVRECEADREALKLYDHSDVLLSMLTKMKAWAVDHLGNADWYPGIDARIDQAKQLASQKDASVGHDLPITPPLSTPTNPIHHSSKSISRF